MNKKASEQQSGGLHRDEWMGPQARLEPEVLWVHRASSGACRLSELMAPCHLRGHFQQGADLTGVGPRVKIEEDEKSEKRVE
jgi:hypothetical protein